jgi:hypothetical protein
MTNYSLAPAGNETPNSESSLFQALIKPTELPGSSSFGPNVSKIFYVYNVSFMCCIHAASLHIDLFFKEEFGLLQQ